MRLSGLLVRESFLELGGTVGGLGWWGGVEHMMGLWGSSGLTGLVELISVLPFRSRSTMETNRFDITVTPTTVSWFVFCC